MTTPTATVFQPISTSPTHEICREDILSLNFIKKSPFMGSNAALRYRFEHILEEDQSKLLVTLWSEPLNFSKTPRDRKQSQVFSFDESGINAAIAWMIDKRDTI
jgi:hypothetical protein